MSNFSQHSVNGIKTMPQMSKAHILKRLTVNALLSFKPKRDVVLDLVNRTDLSESTVIRWINEDERFNKAIDDAAYELVKEYKQVFDLQKEELQKIAI